MADDILIPGQIASPDPSRLFAAGHGITLYNPSLLAGRRGLRVFDEMRRDEQVKVAICFKKHAILAAGWDIASPEGFDHEWEPRVFVQESLDYMRGSFGDRIWNMLSAIEYGYSVAEIVWGQKDRRWIPEDIVSIKPHSLRFDQDYFGNLLSVRQWDIGAETVLPIGKTIIMTYQGEWANPYGRSDLEAAYAAHWGKTNARKWLAMLLERFGVPPIFAMYNYSKYSGPALDSLKEIITNLQAGTASIIPRVAKDDIEMWTPALAGQVAEVFLPALDRYDGEIARAILMPNLLGATPEAETGSFARAAIVFDVFMFAVNSLRSAVEEAINEQLIWRMIAANYPTADAWPEFRFKPLTHDARIALMDTWTKLIASGAAAAGPDDGAYIREIMGFPAATAPAAPDPAVQKKALAQRRYAPVSGDLAQKEIGFVRIAADLDVIEAAFMGSALNALEQVQGGLAKSIRAGARAADIRVPSLRALRRALQELYVSAFEAGREDLASEVNAAVKMQELPRVKPRDAIIFLRRKAITLVDIVSDEILRDVRRILISALETGMSTPEIAAALGIAFEKWVGSDELRDGEPIGPHRLEAIARTESTSAYSHGRVVMARDPDIAEFMRGMRFDAILDGRTSDVCSFLDGRIIRMNDPALDALTPALHVNCRSILTPITVSRQVDESEYITPSEVGRAKELAGAGFAGGGSF